jgi:hypothetical protein
LGDDASARHNSARTTPTVVDRSIPSRATQRKTSTQGSHARVHGVPRRFIRGKVFDEVISVIIDRALIVRESVVERGGKRARVRLERLGVSVEGLPVRSWVQVRGELPVWEREAVER